MLAEAVPVVEEDAPALVRVGPVQSCDAPSLPHSAGRAGGAEAEAVDHVGAGVREVFRDDGTQEVARRGSPAGRAPEGRVRQGHERGRHHGGAAISDYKAKRLATKSRQTGQTLSAAAINRPLALLRHLLHLAHEEWSVLDSIPTVRLEDEPEGRLRWLTPEEANRLLVAARESRNADLADLIEPSLFTGLRQSEALELTWDRVDRSRGVLLLEVTKSGRRRQVPLNEAADAVLARRRPKDSGLVFGSSNWDRYRSAWERAVTRAKLTDLHWHDLRHTFASWAVQRRVSLYGLKELLGHASLTMVKRYAHLAPKHLRGAAAALDGVLMLTGDSEPSATARRQQADVDPVLGAV